MELVFVKVIIPGKNNPQKTLREDIFRYYFEDLKYTRKKFTSELGLNHRIFTYGIKAYYKAEDVEELRVKKIVRSNLGQAITKWEDKLKAIEVFQPGFTGLFKDNIKDNPEVVMKAIVELNDKFYRAKIAIRPIKKYTNQAITRKGGNRVNLVGNGLEARIKFMLDELGIIYECQYKLGKYYFDFRVGKFLLEVDGAKYHANPKKDMIKTRLAQSQGFEIIRITDEMIKKQPLKVRKCLLRLKA